MVGYYLLSNRRRIAHFVLGGSTYCAIAALTLMGKLDLLPRKDDLVHWCVSRQISGFQGRINKPSDSCYSFWIGNIFSQL